MVKTFFVSAIVFLGLASMVSLAQLRYAFENNASFFNLLPSAAVLALIALFYFYQKRAKRVGSYQRYDFVGVKGGKSQKISHSKRKRRN